MLKKAGIVVLGAAAGMGFLAPLASAGEAPATASGGHEQSWGGDHGGHGHGPQRDGGGSCDDIAAAGESSGVVNAPNALSNLDLTHVNILANDASHDGCHGGGGGKAAVAGPSSGVVNAPNLLANPTISHVNVLASDTSRN